MPELNGIKVNLDCRFFKGDIPCRPHKEKGYHCSDCPEYSPIKKRILIIKLGAIGDVIRTTPLISRIRKEFDGAKITWLTLSPAVLPAKEIDEILKYDAASLLYVQSGNFDIAYNLDKDKDACALLNKVSADKKFGYMLKDGMPWPVNDLSNHKYLTGVFDDLSKSNTKSYLEEIFEIAGWKFEGEEYLFDNYESKGYQWNLDRSKKLVGLNTGCGDRWTSRLWPEQYWIELVQILKSNGFEPVLLGGEQEHEKNLRLSKESGAAYLGHFSLPQFINLMYQMDVIVTQVTMAMHIAVALKKKLVLMNNIFNPYEFWLYNRGKIVQPDKTCDCFYKGSCIHGNSCMQYLPPAKIYSTVKEIL